MNNVHAKEYSEKPLIEQKIISLEDLRQISSDGNFGFIGQSKNILKIFKMVEKIADRDTTILINGETGTGKGLLARLIHNKSNRNKLPFVKINCGAIPDHLLESELFGHEKGSFTGATNLKPGKFEIADGGTIFLDEIGDMSYDLQVKLLRVLEENEFERVGGCKTIKTDVRIIAATHRNLEEEVKKGNFREDLYYRLFIIPLFIPALQERKSDIPILLSHFLSSHNNNFKTVIHGISNQALNLLMDYSWPGNVRELKNMIERIVALNETGLITFEELPQRLKELNKENVFPIYNISEEGICLNTAVNEFEKQLIIQSLEKSKWVKNKAAKLLHLNRTTLVEKIKRYNLEHCSI
jgi:sigma-54 dependent transcriptional regulator, flagellar regulatory protein